MAQTAPSANPSSTPAQKSVSVEDLMFETLTTKPNAISEKADSDIERDKKMQSFRQAKFGMFIHWGLYSVPAGNYQGKPVGGYSEWIMAKAKIPVAEYKEFAKSFNPSKYDPQAWVNLAQEAGMKYIVITAKHHDGFAMYPSAASDWDIENATPYGKDVIQPLVDATRKAGLKFGTYYSQAQDWVHPGGAKLVAGFKSWDPAQEGDMEKYIQSIAIPQTREILERYQPDIFWWDTPVKMTKASAQALQDLMALRPGIITNDRLGAGIKGDTVTPEQHIPAMGFKDRDWETCMTMNTSWGYCSWDNKWKSSDDLLKNLIDIVSKGGNYLLNVGPNADGEIPEPSVERLKRIGAWMKINGDSIYGTTASPFRKLSWGRCTTKLSENGGKLYLHVFDWPKDGNLIVPGLQSQVSSARLLATGEKVAFRSENGNYILTLPANAPDPIASVIELEFTGPLKVENNIPRQAADGSITLPAALVDIHNHMWARAELEGKDADAKVTKWTNAGITVSWDFMASEPGKYMVQADVLGAGGGDLTLSLGKTKINGSVPISQDAAKRTVNLGEIAIPKAGDFTLELIPIRKDWKGFELGGIKLLKATEAAK